MIGLVICKNYKYLYNCLRAIAKGNTEVTFWTNRWVINKKGVNQVYVFYNNYLIFAGDYMSATAGNNKYILPDELYKNHMNNLNEIGLPINATSDYFRDNLIPQSFKLCDELGEIVIRVNKVCEQGLMSLYNDLEKIKWMDKLLDKKECEEIIKNILDNKKITQVDDVLSMQEQNKFTDGNQRIVYR